MSGFTERIRALAERELRLELRAQCAQVSEETFCALVEEREREIADAMLSVVRGHGGRVP